MYEQLAYTLRHRFPQLEIQGSNYPPGPFKTALSQLLYVLCGIGFLVAFFGGNLLPAEAQRWLNENRMMTLGSLFFMQMIAGNIVQTGAFEVELDGQLLFSKLRTGAVPQVPDLVAKIGQQLKA